MDNPNSQSVITGLFVVLSMIFFFLWITGLGNDSVYTTADRVTSDDQLADLEHGLDNCRQTLDAANNYIDDYNYWIDEAQANTDMGYADLVEAVGNLPKHGRADETFGY